MTEPGQRGPEAPRWPLHQPNRFVPEPAPLVGRNTIEEQIDHEAPTQPLPSVNTTPVVRRVPTWRWPFIKPVERPMTSREKAGCVAEVAGAALLVGLAALFCRNYLPGIIAGLENTGKTTTVTVATPTTGSAASCIGKADKLKYEDHPQDIPITTGAHDSALVTLWRPGASDSGEYTTVQGPNEKVVYDGAEGDVYLYHGCDNSDGFVTQQEQAYDQTKYDQKQAAGELASWRGHVDLATLVADGDAQIESGNPTAQVTGANGVTHTVVLMGLLAPQPMSQDINPKYVPDVSAQRVAAASAQLGRTYFRKG